MLPESDATGISTSTIHIRHTSTSALRYQDRYFYPFAGSGIAVLPTVLLFGLALVPGTPSTLDFLTRHSGLLFQFLFCCHGHAVGPGELILLGDSRTGYTNYFLYSGAFPIAKLPLPVSRRPVLSSWLTSGSCTFHFPSYTSPLSFPEERAANFWHEDLPLLSQTACFGWFPVQCDTSGLLPASPSGHTPAPQCAARVPGKEEFTVVFLREFQQQARYSPYLSRFIYPSLFFQLLFTADRLT